MGYGTLLSDFWDKKARNIKGQNLEIKEHADLSDVARDSDPIIEGHVAAVEQRLVFDNLSKRSIFLETAMRDATRSPSIDNRSPSRSRASSCS